MYLAVHVMTYPQHCKSILLIHPHIIYKRFYELIIFIHKVNARGLDLASICILVSLNIQMKTK